MSAGHSIPYHFTAPEAAAFLARNTAPETAGPGSAALVMYLNTGNPSYGVIVKEAYGEILVWKDAVNRTHVVDVTNMRIARSVQQAPYESPGSNVFVDMRDDFKAVFGAVLSLTQWLAIGAVAVLIIYKWPRKS